MTDSDRAARYGRATRPQSALSQLDRTSKLVPNSKAKQSPVMMPASTSTSGAPPQRPSSAQGFVSHASHLYSTPPPAEQQPALKPAGSTAVPPLSFGERLNQLSTGALLLPLERCYDTAINRKRESTAGSGPQALLGPVGRLVSSKRNYTKSMAETNQAPVQVWTEGSMLGESLGIGHINTEAGVSTDQLMGQYQLSPERYRRPNSQGASESPPLRTVDIYEGVNRERIASAILGAQSEIDRPAVLEDTLRVTPLSSTILKRPVSTTQLTTRQRRDAAGSMQESMHGDRLTVTRAPPPKSATDVSDSALQQKIESIKRSGKKSEFVVDPAQLQGCKLYEQNSKMALDAVRPSTALSSYTRGLNKKYKFSGRIRSASEMGYTNSALSTTSGFRASGASSALGDVDEKVAHETKKATRSMSDWIIKSRSGSVSSASLKKGARSVKSGLSSDVPIPVSVTDDGGVQQIVVHDLEEQGPDTISPDGLGECEIITIDAVLPIFKCIKDRVEIERIIQQEEIPDKALVDQTSSRVAQGSPMAMQRTTGLRQFSDSPFKLAQDYSHSQKFDVCKALKNYFKEADIDSNIFNYTTSYELMMYAENYYMSLRTQYEAFLKTSPELIASSLMQSEFIYLTFDTPAVRKMITYHHDMGYTAADAFSAGNVAADLATTTPTTSKTPQGRSSATGTNAAQRNQADDLLNTASVYARPDPWQNPYELLVCAYHQINEKQYFTLSCNGICYQEPETKTTQLISIKEWERERKFYLELRKNPFFMTFRIRKYIKLWRRNIATAARNKSIAALTRSSLLASTVFLNPLQEIYSLCYQFSLELSFVPFKKYCFELLTVYISKRNLDKQSAEAVYVTLTNMPNTITLKQFVVESRNRITAIKSLLGNYVTTISEILLTLGKQIQQQIQGRIIQQSVSDNASAHTSHSGRGGQGQGQGHMPPRSGTLLVNKAQTSSGHGGDKLAKKGQKQSSKAILSAISSFSVHNLARVRSMIRLADYYIVEAMLDLLLRANNDLMDLFFGLPYITRDAEKAAPLAVKELTQEDLNILQEDGGRKLIVNPVKVQKYLKPDSAKQPSSTHEMLQQLDNEARLSKKKDDYLLLLYFLKTYVGNLAQIAKEAIEDPPIADSVRLARYVKPHEMSTDDNGDGVARSLFMGKIKSSLLTARKTNDALDVYDDLSVGDSGLTKKKRAENPILQKKEQEKEQNLNNIDMLQERNRDIAHLLSQMATLIPDSEQVINGRRFVGVPLCVLKGRLPPAPIFNIQLVLTVDGLCMYPSRTDFIHFVGDVLSDYATCVHRSIRPTSFAKLSSFLSETANQPPLTGTSIKDLLGDYEDYVSGVRALKRNLEYGCDKIKEYTMGFMDVLISVSDCISKLRDDGLIRQLMERKVPITSHSIETTCTGAKDIQHSSTDSIASPGVELSHEPRDESSLEPEADTHQTAEEYARDYAFLCQLASEFDFRMMTQYAFPAVKLSNEAFDGLEIDDTAVYMAGLRHLNNKTVPLIQESENTIKSAYLRLISELNPYLFRARIDSIERIILSLTTLRVKRVILCFQVDSTPIASALLPIMLRLLQFVRFSVPKTVLIVAKNCIHKMEFYNGELKKIPDKSYTSLVFNDASLDDINFLNNEEITTQTIDKEKLLQTKDTLQYFEEARLEHRLFQKLYKKCTIMMSLAAYKGIVNDAGLVEGVQDYFERFFRFKDDPNCHEVMKDFDRSLQIFDVLLTRFAERRTRLYSVFRYDLIVLFFRLQKLCYDYLKNVLDVDKMTIGTQCDQDKDKDRDSGLGLPLIGELVGDVDVTPIGAIETPTQLYYYLLNQTNIEGPDVFEAPISTGSAVCKQRSSMFIDAIQQCSKLDEESTYFYQCAKLFESTEFFMPEDTVVSYYYRNVCLEIPSESALEDAPVPPPVSMLPVTDPLDVPDVNIQGTNLVEISSDIEEDLTTRALESAAETAHELNKPPKEPVHQHIHGLEKKLSLTTMIESEFVIQALRRISTVRRNFWLVMHGLNVLIKKDFTRALCMLDYASVTSKLRALKYVLLTVQTQFNIIYNEARFTSGCINLGNLELKAHLDAHRAAQIEYYEAMAFERQKDSDIALRKEDEAVLEDLFKYLLDTGVITRQVVKSCVFNEVYEGSLSGKPPQSMPGEINQVVLKYLLLIYKGVVADRAIIDEILCAEDKMLSNGKIVKTGEFLHTVRMSQRVSGQSPGKGRGMDSIRALGYHGAQLPDDSDFDSAEDVTMSVTGDLSVSTGTGLNVTDIANPDTRGKIVIPASMMRNIEDVDQDAVLVQYRKQDRIESLLQKFSDFEGIDDYKHKQPEPTIGDAIEYYLRPPSLLNVALELITCVETILPQVKFVSSIAFQPRHFKILTRDYLRSPNLLLEYKLMTSRLITLDIEYKDTPLFEILSQDQNNVYRVLFGPEHDNIMELMMFSATIIGGNTGAGGARNQQAYDHNKLLRNLYAGEGEGEDDMSDKEEEAEKQNIRMKLSGNFSLSVSTISTHIQATSTKFLAHLAARKAQITHTDTYLESEQLGEVRSERDVADSKLLLAQMTNYSFIIQRPSIYSTDLLYNVCYKAFETDREKEEYFQKKAKKRAEITYGGLFIEMDRFTTSISRFVFRGILESNVLANFLLFIRSVELEYTLLSGLSKLKLELDALSLTLIPYVGPLAVDQATLANQAYLISLTDVVSNVLTDIRTELNTLESQFTRLGDNPAMRELIKLKQTCTVCQDAILMWNAYQTKFLSVLRIFAPTSPIVRQLPEDMRTFSKLVKQYITLMGAVTRNQKVVAWCTKDTIHSILGWQAELDMIYINVLKYLDIKRRQFMRFFFLSDNELLLVLSAQDETAQGAPFDASLLTRMLQNCFDNVSSLICENKTEHDVRSLYLKGVRSREGEALMLLHTSTEKDIRIRGSPDIWLSALDTRMVGTLQKVMAGAIQQHVQDMRGMMTIIFDNLQPSTPAASRKDITSSVPTATSIHDDSRVLFPGKPASLRTTFSAEKFLEFLAANPIQVVTVVRQCITWFFINYPQEFSNAASFYKSASTASSTTENANTTTSTAEMVRSLHTDDTLADVFNQDSKFNSVADKDGILSKLQIIDALLEIQEHILALLIKINRNNLVVIADYQTATAFTSTSKVQPKPLRGRASSPPKSVPLRNHIQHGSSDGGVRGTNVAPNPGLSPATAQQGFKLSAASIFPLLATELYIRDLLERKKEQLQQGLDGESNMLCYTFNATEGKVYVSLEEHERMLSSSKFEKLNTYQKKPYYYLFDNAYAAYCYEYHGQVSRLIISPTIDSYRQIFFETMQNLLKGNSLIGNAGTGKTETAKDFARTLGRFCIVLNCTETLEYNTVVRIFMGIAATGSILCLDEFNRLTMETLSLVSKLIISIQQAISKKDIYITLTATEADVLSDVEQVKATRAPNPNYTAKEEQSPNSIRLRPTASVFITMNQSSYIFTNRIELPGNTMTLFRPLMIIKPDIDYIVMGLFIMHGFATAQDLGRRFHLFFTNLSSILVNNNAKVKPKRRPASTDILAPVSNAPLLEEHEDFSNVYQQPENMQLYDARAIDLSLRTIKAVVLASSHTFKRWLYMFRENTYIKSLLVADSNNPKQYKEHMTFMSYIETICVIDNLIRLLTPCLVELDKQNFIELISDVFGRDIVMCYMENDKYDNLEKATTQVDDLSEAVMNSSFMLINNINSIANSSFLVPEPVKKQAPQSLGVDSAATPKAEEEEASDMSQIVHPYQSSLLYMLLTESELWPSLQEAATNYGQMPAYYAHNESESCYHTDGDTARAIPAVESGHDLMDPSQAGQSGQSSQYDRAHASTIYYRTATNIMTSKLNVGKRQITALAQAQALVAESIQRRADLVLSTYFRACIKMGYISFRYQGEKFFELENLLWIRNGIIILGHQNSFKTMLWRLTLDETNDFTVINPHALSTEGLLGGYKNNIFYDGTFSSILREYCIASHKLMMEKKRQKEEKEFERQMREAKRRGKKLAKQHDINMSEEATDEERSHIEEETKGAGRSTSDLKFIILDGSLDSAYAECMNSLLDDNKMLCLANGERIHVSNYVRVIFETSDISQASPSTLSRCGVLCLEDNIQTYNLLYRSILLTALRTLFELDYLDFIRTYKYNSTKIQSYIKLHMGLQTVELLFDKMDAVLGLSGPNTRANESADSASNTIFGKGSAGYSTMMSTGPGGQQRKRTSRKERLKEYRARDPTHDPLEFLNHMEYYARHPLHFDNNLYVNVLDVFSTMFAQLFGMVTSREQVSADAPSEPEAATTLDLTFLCANMNALVQQSLRIFKSHLCASSSHIYDLVSKDPTRGTLVRLLQGYAIFSVVWSCISFFGKKLYLQCIDTRFQEIIFERKYWAAAFHVNSKQLKQELEYSLDQCFFDPQKLIPVPFIKCGKFDHLRDYNKVYWTLGTSRDYDLDKGIFNVSFDTVTSRIFVETTDVRRSLYVCLNDLLYHDDKVTLSRLLTKERVHREEQSASQHKQRGYENIGTLNVFTGNAQAKEVGVDKHVLAHNAMAHASMTEMTTFGGGLHGDNSPGASGHNISGITQAATDIPNRSNIKVLAPSNSFLQISGFGANTLVNMLVVLLQQSAKLLPIPLRFSATKKTLTQFTEYFENCFKHEDNALLPMNTIGGTNLFILNNMNMAIPTANNMGVFTCFPINEFIAYLMQNNSVYVGSSPPKLHTVRNYQIINVGPPLVTTKTITHSLIMTCTEFADSTPIISSVFTAWSAASHIKNAMNPVVFSILPLITTMLAAFVDGTDPAARLLKFTYTRLFEFLRRFCMTTASTFRSIAPTDDALRDTMNTSAVRRALLQILLSCLRVELFRERSDKDSERIDQVLTAAIVKHLSTVITELRPSASIRVPAKLRPDVILNPDTVYLSDIVEVKHDPAQKSRMQVIMQQEALNLDDQRVPLIEVVLQTGNLTAYDLNNYQYRQVLPMSADVDHQRLDLSPKRQESADVLSAEEEVAEQAVCVRGNMSHQLLQTFSDEPTKSFPSLFVTSSFPQSYDAMVLPTAPLPDLCPHVSSSERFTPLVGGMQQELKRRMLKLAYDLAKPDSHLVIVYLAGIFVEQTIAITIEALKMKARVILDVQELYQLVYGGCCIVNDTPTCFIIMPSVVQSSLPFLEQLLSDPHFLAINNYHLVILAEPSVYRHMKDSYKNVLDRCAIEVPDTWPMVEIALSAVKLLPAEVAKVFCMSPDGLIPIHKLTEENIETTMLYRFAHSFSLISDLYKRVLDGEHLIKTPVVFARFLRTYYKMFNERKMKLVEQEARLEKGLELFEQSSAQADELEEKLEKLQPQLEHQKKKVASILAEISEKRLLAQEQHTVVSSEKVALTIEDKSISAEMAQAKKELNRVLPALQKADEALQNLNRQDIAELSTFTNPHPLVVLVMNALCALMNQPTNWSSARQLLSSGNLISTLLSYDKKNINPKVLAKFRSITSTPDFNPAKISSISTAATTICTWCLAIVDYATAWDNVRPKITRLEKARQDYLTNKQNMEIKEVELEKLQALLQQLNADAEKNKAIEQELESQIKVAEERYKLVKNVKTLLEVEHETWQESLTELKSEHATLATTVTESVKFMYIPLLGIATSAREGGREDVKTSSSSREKVWSAGQLSEFVNLKLVRLHDDEQLCMWRRHCLPSDNSTTESMGCLMNSVDCPYIFDPEAMAETFLSNLPNVVSIKYTPDDQRSVLQRIVEAGISGKVCLITNLSLEIPSFITEIVKQITWDPKLLFSDADEQEDDTEEQELEMARQARAQKSRDLETTRKNLFIQINEIQEEEDDNRADTSIAGTPAVKTPTYTVGMFKKIATATPDRRKVKIMTSKSSAGTAATTPRAASSINTPRFNPYNDAMTPDKDFTDPTMQMVMENSIMVKVHGYEYLFSKRFNIILLSNDISLITQLSPELITNFQVVSFAKSRAAIEEHLISIIVRSINPKIERSYLNAVVEASIAKSSLKILELHVLDTLMKSSLEEILSDELLTSLHSTSVQKASIKRRLLFITKMHQKIEHMRDTYRSVALQCTSIFLCIRQVLKLSLQTYSQVITRIIICNNDVTQNFANNTAYSHILNLSTAIQLNSPYLSAQNTPSFHLAAMAASFAAQSPLNASVDMSETIPKVPLIDTLGMSKASEKKPGMSTLAVTHIMDSFEEDGDECSEKEAQDADECSLEDLVSSHVQFEQIQKRMEEQEMAELTVELDYLRQSKISDESNKYVETILALFIMAFDESSAVALLYHIFTYLDVEMVKEPLLWIMLKCLIISGHDYARVVGHASTLGQYHSGNSGKALIVDNSLDMSVLQESFFNIEKLYVRNNTKLENMPLPMDMRKAFAGPGENAAKISAVEILQRRSHAANLMYSLFCVDSDQENASEAIHKALDIIGREQAENSPGLKYCAIMDCVQPTENAESTRIFINPLQTPYNFDIQHCILSSAVYHWDVWQKCMSVTSSDQAIAAFTELMKTFMLGRIFEDPDVITRFEDHLLILFIKHFKPTFLRIAINNYVTKSMTRYQIYVSGVQKFNFSMLLNISDSQLPIFLNHSPSIDAVRFISQFLPQESYQLMQSSTAARETIIKARKNAMLKSNTATYADDNPIIELKTISLSKGSEQTVLNSLSKYFSSPVWLVLQNAHLIPEFVNNELRRHYASLTANSYRADLGDGSVFEASMMDHSMASMSMSTANINQEPVGATATLRGSALPSGVVATPLLRAMRKNLFQPGGVDCKPCSRHFKLIVTAEGDMSKLAPFAQMCLTFKRSSDVTFSSVYKRTMELSQKYFSNFKDMHEFDIEYYKEEHAQTTIGITDINTILTKNSYSIAAIVSRCSFGTHGWTSVYSAFDESDLEAVLVTLSKIIAHELVYNDNCLIVYRKLIENVLNNYGAKLGTKHDRTVLKYLLEFVFGYNSRQVRAGIDSMSAKDPSLLYNRGGFDTDAMKKMINNAILQVDINTVRDNPRHLGLADAEKVYLYRREGQAILEFLDSTLGSGVMYSIAKSVAYNVRLVHYDRRKLAASLPSMINVRIDENEKSCPLMFFMYQEIMYYNRIVKDLMDYVRYSKYDSIPDYILQFMIQRHVDNLYKLVNHLTRARAYYSDAMTDRNYMNIDITLVFRPAALFTAFRAQACYITGGTMDQYTLAYDIVPYANMRQRENVQISGLLLKSAYVDLSIGKVSSKSVSIIYNPLPAMRVLAQRVYKKKSVIISLGNFSATINASEQAKKNMNGSFSRSDMPTSYDESAPVLVHPIDNYSASNMLAHQERRPSLRPMSSRSFATALGAGRDSRMGTPTLLPAPLPEIKDTGSELSSAANTPQLPQRQLPQPPMQQQSQQSGVSARSRLGKIGFKLTLNIEQRSSSRKSNKSLTVSSTEGSQDTSPRDEFKKASSIVSVSSVTDSSSDTDFVEARSLNVIELNVLKKYDGLKAKNIFDRRMVYFSNKNYSAYYRGAHDVIECPIFVDIYSKEMGSIASVFLPCAEQIEKITAGDIFIVIHED